MKRSGFTLVELLVVVAIIVILLAMLVPSMQKAVYQATLAVCATNQKAMASVSQTYAFDNKRFYPYRDLPRAATGNNGIQAHKLTHPLESGSGFANYDLRPMLRPYIAINTVFNDPFTQALNYDDREATAATMSIYTSVYYWAGWHYSGVPSGMFKIGDTFQADALDEPVGGGRFRKYNISLLFSDIDCAEGNAYSSHPDFKILFNRVIENPAWIESNWVAVGNEYREPLDLNYAFDDGSVERKPRVEYFEDDMIRISNFSLNSVGKSHVPKR